MRDGRGECPNWVDRVSLPRAAHFRSFPDKGSRRNARVSPLSCQQEATRGVATASTARQVVSSAAIISNDRAEAFPALTLKPCHLKLLDN